MCYCLQQKNTLYIVIAKATTARAASRRRRQGVRFSADKLRSVSVRTSNAKAIIITAAGTDWTKVQT